MPTNINTNFLSFDSLVSRSAPDAKVLPVAGIDFTRDTQFTLDLTATVQSAQLANPIQACYVDASRIPYGATTLTVFGTGQSITVPAGVQGYYPLLISAHSYIFTLSNGYNKGQTIGTATLNIFFVNVPMVAAEWSILGTQPGAGVVSPTRTVVNPGGGTIVTDNVQTSDGTVLYDCTQGECIAYLPTALTTGQTQIFNLGKSDALANFNLQINGNGNGIDGAQQFNVWQGPANVQVQWTGAQWKVLAQHDPLIQIGTNGSLSYVPTFSAGIELLGPMYVTPGWQPYACGVSVSAGSSSGLSQTLASAVYFCLGPICFFNISYSGSLGPTSTTGFVYGIPKPVVGGRTGWMVSSQILPAGGNWQSGWGGVGYPTNTTGNIQLNNGASFPPGSTQFFVSGFYQWQ